VVKTDDTGRADEFGGGGVPGLGWMTLRSVPEAGVDPLGVVVGHVVSEQAPEMRFAEDDHVIDEEPDVQELEAYGGDECEQGEKNLSSSGAD
jgi:hypothetical protein